MNKAVHTAVRAHHLGPEDGFDNYSLHVGREIVLLRRRQSEGAKSAVLMVGGCWRRFP